MTEHLNSARATSTRTPETASPSCWSRLKRALTLLLPQIDAYKSLLAHLDQLEADFEELSSGKPRNEQVERTLETIGALKLEAWSALGEWERALELAEVSIVL